MVMLSVSEPSVSVRSAEMLSGMVVSSLPPAGATLSSGSLAVVSPWLPMTVTSALTAAESPSFSVAVEVTERLNSGDPSGTVTVRPSSWSEDRVQVPSGFNVPADRLTPTGRPATVTLSVSEPSLSVSAVLMSNGKVVKPPPVPGVSTWLTLKLASL